MVDGGAEVRVFCTGCREWQQLDIAALEQRAGRSYSLFNRRCRCRLTPGCTGWNRFYYLLGVYRPLWSQDRWIDTVWRR